MILIILCLILASIFLVISYKYMNNDLYNKYSMLFFILNCAAVMIVLITLAYLFIAFILMGELYV